MENNEDYEIREHDIEHVLGRTPNVLMRLGISVIFAVFLIIIAGSAFFSYPDLLLAKIVLVTEKPPVSIVCKNSGKLGRLLKPDQAGVKKGEIIAVIENPAETEDVLRLIPILECTDIDTIVSLILSFGEQFHLGDLQTVFTQLKYNILSYEDFQKLRYHYQRIKITEEQINYIEEYIKYNSIQTEFLNDELTISSQNYESSNFLNKQNIISRSDLDNSKVELLQKKYNLTGNLAALANSKAQHVQLKQNVLDLKLDYQKQKKNLEDQILESIDLLRSLVKQWEQLNIIRSLQDGVLSYTGYWEEGNFIQSGDIIFTVVPEQGGKVIGRLELPAGKSGKVKVGQQVHIKVDNYPYMEYGILNGIIHQIALLPNKEYLRVDVELPEGLKTSYRKNLVLIQNMGGTAEIITEDHSVLHRVLFPLKSLMKNN